ncbi:hypothetical protein HDU93_003200 [Gonapodya sp. JEL0774]|nr:hypothetical protein HDU93_003200 [Gonapodya sp. JEL0774]
MEPSPISRVKYLERTALQDLHDVLDSITSFIAGLKKNGKASVTYTSEAASKRAGYAEQIKVILFAHLAIEETQLFCELEVRRLFTAEEAQDVKKAGALHVQLASEDPFTSLPFFIYHLSAADRVWAVINDLPWIVAKVPLPYVFSRRWRGAWTFATEWGTSGKI